jgi:hypothetical protein
MEPVMYLKDFTGRINKVNGMVLQTVLNPAEPAGDRGLFGIKTW